MAQVRISSFVAKEESSEAACADMKADDAGSMEDSAKQKVEQTTGLKRMVCSLILIFFTTKR